MAWNRSVLDDWWDRYRLPVLGLGVVALGLGAQFESIRGAEAVGALLIAPVASVALGLRDIDGALRVVSLLVGGLVAVMVAVVVQHVAFEHAPLAEVELSMDHPTARVQLPADVSDVEVDTTATLVSGGAEASGSIVARLEREGVSARVSQSFAHRAAAQRLGRRTVRSNGVHTQQVARERVPLAGRGELAITLLSASGSLLPRVHVSIRAAPPWASSLRWIMALSTLAAVVIQALAARRRVHTYVAGAVGVGAVLGPYVDAYFNPYEGPTSTLGALVVAIVVGGGAGILGRLVLDRLMLGAGRTSS